MADTATALTVGGNRTTGQTVRTQNGVDFIPINRQMNILYVLVNFHHETIWTD